MGIDSALARPSRLGTVTALGTAFGILILCFVFQLVVPTPATPETAHIVQSNLNIRSFVLYATAGGVHILLCAGSMVFFWEQLRRGESKLEFANVLASASSTFCIIILVVLVACYLDMKVVAYSYEERLRPMESDQHLAFLLTKHVIPFVNAKAQLFALFPFILIAFGVAAAIVGCFWIAHKVITFTNRVDDLKSHDILALRRHLAQLIGLVTVVFTTSTIATVALMQIGRDWIEKGPTRDVYIQNGHAMSIFWSACYTSVIALMVILPLWWVARRTRRIQQQARRSGGHPTFYDQVFELVSYKSIVQAGIAILAPLLTSSIAAVFGS